MEQVAMAGPLMHSVEVEADAQTIFDAIATTKGLAAFWTRDSKAEPKEGSVAVFGFGGPTQRMRVDELRPGRRVLWTALDDFPNWRDTTVSWDLSPVNGRTEVRFSHDGWPAELPATDLASINYVWGQIVGRLKKYAETGEPDPYFP
jgi:uncharacterized protein YndB with AHSA1/START domain